MSEQEQPGRRGVLRGLLASAAAALGLGGTSPPAAAYGHRHCQIGVSYLRLMDSWCSPLPFPQPGSRVYERWRRICSPCGATCKEWTESYWDPAPCYGPA